MIKHRALIYAYNTSHVVIPWLFCRYIDSISPCLIHQIRHFNYCQYAQTGLWAYYLGFLFASQFPFSLHVLALCGFNSHSRITILICTRPNFISFDLIFECVVNITCCVCYFLHILLHLHSSIACSLIGPDLIVSLSWTLFPNERILFHDDAKQCFVHLNVRVSLRCCPWMLICKSIRPWYKRLLFHLFWVVQQCFRRLTQSKFC